MSLSFSMLLVCVFPILVWMNQEPTCGPHNADASELSDGTCVDGVGPDGCEGTGAKVFETVGVYLAWLERRRIESQDYFVLQGELSAIASFFVSPPVLIIVLCVMHTRHQYTKAAFNGMQEQLERTSKASAHKEKALTDVMRLEMKQHAEARATSMTSSKVRKDVTPAEFREAQMANLRRCFAALDIDLRHRQFGQTRALNANLNRSLDNATRSMDSTRLLARARQLSPSGMQEQFALKPCVDHAQDDDSSDTKAQHFQNMIELMAAATVLVRNIDPEFAKARIVEQVVKDRTQDRVLACTVYCQRFRTISSWQASEVDSTVSDEAEVKRWLDADFGKDGRNRSVFAEYPHDSWALVTFAHQTTAARMCREYDIAAVNLNVASQPFLGSWHVVSWKEAMRMLPYTTRVRKLEYIHARAQHNAAQHRLLYALGGEQSSEGEPDEAQLLHTANAAAGSYEYARCVESSLIGVLGDIRGSVGHENSAFMRKHNIRLAASIETGMTFRRSTTADQQATKDAGIVRRQLDRGHAQQEQGNAAAVTAAEFVNPLGDAFEVETNQTQQLAVATSTSVFEQELA